MPAERAGYTVTIFVIDISKSMGETRSVAIPPGPRGEERWTEMTNLEWALRYVKLKIQEMIHNGRKTDQCGVIVFGSPETDNIVNKRENGEGYENVSEYIKIGQPNIGTLARLDALQPSETYGDPLDALIVAAETQQEYLATKKTWTRRIFLATDAESPIEEEDWQAIVGRLKQYNVELRVIGIDFDDEENGYEYPDKSPQKKHNEPFLHEFIEAMGDDAALGTMEFALQEVMKPEVKTTRSTLMGQVLRIGDPDYDKGEAIEIVVRTSKATALTRPSSLKKFALREDDEGEQAMVIDTNGEKHAEFVQLKIRTEFYVDTEASEEKDAEEEKDEDEDEELLLTGSPEKGEAEKKKAEALVRVDKEELVKGFKYGTTYVPCPDGQFAKLETVKGISILYFFTAKNFRRELAMGEVYFVWGDPSSPQQQVALSSIVQAMSNERKYAVARFVGRDGAEPKMVVLAPSNVGDIDCLLMVRMPFADDVRKYTFASLDHLVNKKGEKVGEHPYIPTQQQLDVMDAFVDAMDLNHAGEKDAYGERGSWFSTQDAYNPAIHRIKQAIFHSAVVPDVTTNPLPAPHPELLKYMTSPPKLLKKAKDELEVCKNAFNVKEVPKRVGRKGKDGHVHAPDEEDAPLLLDRQFTRTQSHFLDEPAPNMNSSGTPSKKEQSAEENSDTEDDDDEDLLLGALAKKPTPGSSNPPLLTPARSMAPPPAKRSKHDVVKQDGDEDVDMDIGGEGDAGRAPGRIIGNTHPLKDFKQNLKQGDVVTKAVEDMGAVVTEIVMKPFAKRRHDELLACMKDMRKTCLLEDEVEPWNAFLNQLKRKCLASPGNAAFWALIKGQGRKLSLISDTEAGRLGGTSQYTDRQAEEFVA